MDSLQQYNQHPTPYCKYEHLQIPLENHPSSVAIAESLMSLTDHVWPMLEIEGQSKSGGAQKRGLHPGTP